MTRHEEWTRKIGFGLVLAGLAAASLLAFCAAPSAASPVATHKATSTCWKDVINDWVRHQPNVVGTYALPCYTQAIQRLNKYPDIQQYSNAPDDIHRALLEAIRNKQNSKTTTTTTSSTTTTTGATSGPSSSGGTGPGANGKGPTGSGPKGSKGTGAVTPVSKSFVTKLFDSVGPGNATSIPLPLLVLAGLAVLLLLAAVATWLAKRIQARRMAPAPAPAERR
jgi:cobalamin biosynthesis Mg chelatase CobN